MFVPVIMAGGSGSRLWPLSRQLYPKQFLPLLDSNLSMLQATINRLHGLDHQSPLLVCSEDHRFLAAEQLRQIGLDNATILLEPVARNTAPAIALAALQSIADGKDPILLVLAADHLIGDDQTFQESIKRAEVLAGLGRLVTFGIVPTSVETGYGYLQRGLALEQGGFKVSRFVEKPDNTTAQHYLDSGEYFWNSGMFMFKASRYLQELDKFCPEIVSCCRNALLAGSKDLFFSRVDSRLFSNCPDNSIDYAVMEKTNDAVMVSLDAGWSDIGSWSALWEAEEKNDQGNSLKGDVFTLDTTGCYIRSENRFVAAVGVDELVVIETKDAVLISRKNKVQEVKKVVDYLRDNNRSEHVAHKKVYRPWGEYDAIGAGERYQVKRITVKPGHKLSVQMHHHRAEHWIVVSGTAKVTNGEKTYLVTENQSTYIPIGGVHALENPGIIPLELIEVQSGSYLGEDDIVRFSDQYGRC
ncbi:mannose-1-phosphate guanylyltransferase/mannose-6-phosphate isomerase [Pseudomonas protegens]|uniref:mannose-1-phosphate guanylyltransferase/mannose-6-phosphate isomerase n=1 Tax=Pseudomonas protegens TaxID=380021 RepID=UPI0037F9C7DD